MHRQKTEEEKINNREGNKNALRFQCKTTKHVKYKQQRLNRSEE